MVTFIRNKNWRVFNSYVIAVVVLGIISAGIFGLNEHWNFIKQLSSGSKYVGIFPSMSFFFIMMLFLPEDYEKIAMLCNIIFGMIFLIIWWKRANKNPTQSNQTLTFIVDIFVITVVIIMLFPSSWWFYHAFLIIPFYFVLFGWLQNKNQFRYIGVFIVLFCLINFWEIICYQLPLSLNGLTIHEVGENKQRFPVLYPLIYSIPFVLNILFFFWLLINYNELQQVLKSLKSRKVSMGNC